jgi:hypothetical protein
MFKFLHIYIILDKIYFYLITIYYEIYNKKKEKQ